MLGVLVINLTLYFYWDTVISLDFFYLVAKFNFALCLFNLIPIPPLDGFSIASELFPSIKHLGHSQMGLALFMILFISGAGGQLFLLADLIVKALIL